LAAYIPYWALSLCEGEMTYDPAIITAMCAFAAIICGGAAFMVKDPYEIWEMSVLSSIMAVVAMGVMIVG
jgi:hypothetical protein